MKILTSEESRAITERLCRAFMDGYNQKDRTAAQLADKNYRDCYDLGWQEKRREQQ